MTHTMIRVENLGKLYHIGAVQKTGRTLVGSVANGMTSMLRRAVDPRVARAGSNDVEELWALRNISFELKQGEVLGIIGRNGSGKSTLLKILSRITAPSEGRVDLYGRVGSLLEVGIGFHPELTGRENVYLSGTILGMRKAQIDRIFDEVVDFAEVERFIDTPVKHYSSGMYVRLAFAVAAHFDPEILILDEVLSVGDTSFQKKSLAKMEAAAKSGKTVLFVSHALSSVTRLCDRGLFLVDGQMACQGNITEAVSAYLKMMYKIDEDRLKNERDALLTRLDLRDSPNRWDGCSRKIITWISSHHLQGEPCAEFDTGDSIRIRVGYDAGEPLPAYCRIDFLDYAGVRTMALHSTHNGSRLQLSGAGFLECVITDSRLVAGNYIVMVTIGEASDHSMKWLDCISDTLHIRINPGHYLGGVGLQQGEVPFAQRSEWHVRNEAEPAPAEIG